MPIEGYGVYQIDPTECERCVSDALKTGYRMIDTAQAYHNEEGVGAAIAKSGIPREEFGCHIMSWGPLAERRNNFFTNPLLETIGRKYGKSVAQVALRWLPLSGFNQDNSESRPLWYCCSS